MAKTKEGQGAWLCFHYNLNVEQLSDKNVKVTCQNCNVVWNVTINQMMLDTLRGKEKK